MNEKRDKKFAKYQVKEIPKQFESIKEFNQMATCPLGSEWNSLNAHKNLIQREVELVPGNIIEPIIYKEPDQQAIMKKKKVKRVLKPL